MYSLPIAINGVSVATHVHKKGPDVQYTPVYGLQQKMTLDGTDHVDYAKMRPMVIVPFNPLSPAAAKEIKALLSTGVMFLTYQTVYMDEPETVRVKPVPFTLGPGLTKGPNVAVNKINNVAFEVL